MNRKQQRRERKMKNRENYFINRRNWCLRGGPLVVMDDPTEEHVKALLMVWIAPQKMLVDLTTEINNKVQERVDSIILKTLLTARTPETVVSMEETLWQALARISTLGATVMAPPLNPTIKVW